LMAIGRDDRGQWSPSLTTAAEVQQRSRAGRRVAAGVTDLRQHQRGEVAIEIAKRCLPAAGGGAEHKGQGQGETEFTNVFHTLYLSPDKIIWLLFLFFVSVPVGHRLRAKS